MGLGTFTSFALVLLPLACIAQTKPGDPMPRRNWVECPCARATRRGCGQ